MKRITLILGVVAVMVAMLVALSAPAMAKDNGGNNNHGGGKDNDGHHNSGINRLDNRLDRLDNRLDNRFDLDRDLLVSDVDVNPFLTSTSNVNTCWFWNGQTWVWVCDLGSVNVDDVGFDRVNVDFDTVDIDRDIDDVDFVDVDRDTRIIDGNNHDGGKRHNGNGNGNNHNNNGGGKKGNGK